MLRGWASALCCAFGWPEKTDDPAVDLTGDLPDDLIVEILSRLPYKSVCRFKCVSRHWLHDLITHPDFRAKIPQTLTGFFRYIAKDNHSDGSGDQDYGAGADVDGYDSSDDDLYYVGPNVDGSGFRDNATPIPDFLSIVGEKEHHVVSPSLSFLPGDVYRSIRLKHCSDGLVVCLCWKVFPKNEADYVVCNPATQQWVTVPGYGHRNRYIMPLHLAADPASASGHFHLFATLENRGYIVGVDIYSSETRAWSRKETGWAHDASTYRLHIGVFLNGMLHIVTTSRTIVAVDTKGAIWKTICLLDDMKPTYLSQFNAIIGKSQGRLYYVNNSRTNYTLSVWMIEGDDDKWIPKYKITNHRLFRPKFPVMHNISLVAIHPECNTIFFTNDVKLMSYDMDRGETRVHGILNSLTDGWEFKPYLPYVPSWRSIR